MSKTIFINANLLDGRNPAVPGATVVVERNTVTEVTSAPDVASGAGADDTVVDLGGMTLMPGMFGGHMHIDATPNEPYNYMNIYSRSERPPGVLMARAIKNCQTLLASGITSYVGAGCGADIDAQLRIAIADELLDGPRITASGRHLNTTGHDQDMAKWWYDMSYHPFDLFVDGPDEFRKAVRTEINRGVDIIKLAPTSGHGGAGRGRGLNHMQSSLVVEAAHDRGKKVRAHCVWRDMIIECIEAGVDVIDHGDQADERCIELMAEHGTTWVPSMKFLTVLKAIPPNMHILPRGDVERDWANYCKMLPIANAAGVNIVPGDDYGVGAMPHRPGIYGEELTIYVNDVGVDALDVLRWATSNGAKLSGHDVGEISVGKLADLLVVDGDPSSDITLLENATNIKAVMVDGQFVRGGAQLAASDRLATSVS